MGNANKQNKAPNYSFKSKTIHSLVRFLYTLLTEENLNHPFEFMWLYSMYRKYNVTEIQGTLSIQLKRTTFKMYPHLVWTSDIFSVNMNERFNHRAKFFKYTFVRRELHSIGPLCLQYQRLLTRVNPFQRYFHMLQFRKYSSVLSL